MIKKLLGNPSLCNTYIIGEEGKKALLVDPGDNASNRLDRYIDAHYSALSGILLTHGHYDHILGLSNLRHKAPLYLSESDLKCLSQDKYNLLRGLEIRWDDIKNPIDGEKLLFPEIGEIEVIATPFHTEGSLCYYIEKEGALLSGDTLFHLSYGRTDLPSGDESLIPTSLSKLKRLPEATKVYPGHGESTSIGNELRFNPGFRLI